MNYAYIRVSSKDQNTDRQLLAIKNLDIPEDYIFIDYCSGKDFNRPEYNKLIEVLKDGDVLFIKSIDRLGRNYEEILVQWQYITKKLRTDIVVLDMELLDTRNKSGNLTGTLISDLVLQIFAYVAQTEREFIRQRQAEGIIAAKAKGKKFGRKPMTIPNNYQEVKQKYINGEITSDSASEVLGMSRSTFFRINRREKMV